ncbi:50S ribosomal protein L15e [Candidatus Parvarchaeota archaeon]|nr:50S ribosomal protein L15e [Candidatus Parvarchaeota archaeon]
MGVYKYIREAFQQQYREKSPAYRARLVSWRKGPTIERVEHPTNLSRARTLGYKAKKGYVVVRVRTGRGSRKRPHPWGGRKPAKNKAYVNPGQLYRSIAEKKAARKYPNLEVLNSYFVGADGQYKYSEVLLVEPSAYAGRLQSGRAYRGLTFASRKARGLAGKGKGYEQA